ncbi:Sak single strand annealing protein [Enterococcus alishanensis]
MSERKSFEELSQIDYQSEIKQKEGGKDKETGEKIYLKYLSWATAHKIMKSLDAESVVTEHEFEHYSVLSGQSNDFLITEMKPYRQTGDGYMVTVSVELFGKKETENYAIINFRGQPVLKPTSSDINKALKRAFVKALAKHGIGLYLYEGEDIPDQPKIDVKEAEKLEKLLASLDEKTGVSNKNSLLKTVNKYTDQDSRYGKRVKEITDMTYDQSGLFKIALNTISMNFDKEQKK